jgi:hypothetical protein
MALMTDLLLKGVLYVYTIRLWQKAHTSFWSYQT